MFVELTSLKEVVSGDAGHAQRQLWHNNSLQSIYEFPQSAGSPIYFPAVNPVFVNTYAAGQRPILPGSGEKPGLYSTGETRPTYFMRERTTNGAADTSLGYIYNSGDTAWMLSATALVLLMTMPGLAIYYSGMVRDKNVLSCTMQVFVVCCLITMWWMIFGYSLSFAPAYPNGHTNEGNKKHTIIQCEYNVLHTFCSNPSHSMFFFSLFFSSVW